MDLFRELLRIYPTAEIEDYYKAGLWKTDCMRMDYNLIEAHRNEGGAPEPPPLEDIPVPELPKSLLRPAVGMNGTGPGYVKLPAQAQAPVLSQIVKPSTARSTADSRILAVFVAKHKLDPSRAKTLVMGLEPKERRAVFIGFKSTGVDKHGTDALEGYIMTCKDSGVWKDWPVISKPGAAVLANGASANSTTEPSVGSNASALKRPIVAASQSLDASKRPKVVLPSVHFASDTAKPAPAGPRPPAGRPPAQVVPPAARAGAGIVVRPAGRAS